MCNLFISADVLKENMLLSGSSINSLTIISKQYLKKWNDTSRFRQILENNGDFGNCVVL
jgi:hypothetical protein